VTAPGGAPNSGGQRTIDNQNRGAAALTPPVPAIVLSVSIRDAPVLADPIIRGGQPPFENHVCSAAAEQSPHPAIAIPAPIRAAPGGAPDSGGQVRHDNHDGLAAALPSLASFNFQPLSIDAASTPAKEPTK
jgi:hypothetical protein